MFEQKVLLMGIMPKKGKGKLDNGQDWVTDRVELHVQMALDKDKGGLGNASQMIKLQDCDKWLEPLKPMVGKEVLLISELTTDGKGGGQSIRVVGVRSISTNKAAA